jgi:hypothetical protein
MFNLYNQQQNEPVIPAPKREDLPRSDFRKYQDPTGEFDNKQFRYSLWWVSHKVLLYRVLVIGLIAINVLLWGISIGRWGAYVFGFGDHKSVEMSLSRFANYSATNERLSPKPLQIGSTNVFSSGVGKVDAVNEVTNPNDKFTATITYAYVTNGTSTPEEQVTILAGQSGLISTLGIPEDLATGPVALHVLYVHWKRISSHKVADPIAFQNDRLKFAVSNFSFKTPAMNPDLKTNQVAFTLKNESPYSYKQPEFLVGLYNQNTLVGVLPFQLPDMYSMDERQVDLRSFASSLLVTEISVFPLIDVYDKAVFLAPK